jgi:hypothetical protein
LATIFVAWFWLTTPAAEPGQIVVFPDTRFAKGPFFASVAPWGGRSEALTALWSNHADAMVVSPSRFPANTHMTWRWPPFSQRTVGVWAYNAVTYGRYVHDQPQYQVAPIRVRNIKTLRSTFQWSISDSFGTANVLNEFFLFGSPIDASSKRLEVGWLLHAPSKSRRYFESQPLVGRYVDDQGRAWQVRQDGQYCMFAPDRASDQPSGTINMLHALEWLHGKGKVRGDEWFTGFAIGIEPTAGIGSFDLHEWQVTVN